MKKQHYCTGWRNAPASIDSCCHQHDRDYGVQGTVSRAEADKLLRECLIDRGYPVKAWAFWVIVRLFGWMFYKRNMENRGMK